MKPYTPFRIAAIAVGILTMSLIVAASFWPTAQSQRVAVVIAVEESAVHVYPAYDTIEEAAIAGFELIALQPTAPYYEFGAQIVKTKEGKFTPLTPSTDFKGDGVRVRDPESASLGTVVGSYHTHPCLPEHYVDYFSSDDLEEPVFYRRTTFMGNLCTGEVHEFKPGDKPDAEQPNKDDEQFLSKGRVIGKFTTPHTLIAVAQ